MRFFFYWYAIKPATPFTKMYSVFRCSNFNDIGGQGWIRTIEDRVGRFTVCSLWPLGNLPILTCGAGDRNRTNNLLITNQLLCLLSYTSVIGASGRTRTTDTGIFSPLLYHLSYRGIAHSITLATFIYVAVTYVTATYNCLATRRGLEPLTSSVTGWRSTLLSYVAVWRSRWDSNP